MNQTIDKNFILGILGGMGPLAGIELQKKIITASPAKRDQDHIKMICFTNPHINDRTSCLNNGEDFSTSIATSLNQLENFGALVGIIACNTAHAQIEAIKSKTKLLLINIVEETVAYIANNFPRAKKIGLLATDGTINAHVYNQYLEKCNLQQILPDKEKQAIVMELIYNETGLKSCFIDNKINIFVLDYLIQDLLNSGADLVILGCTELSMLKVNNNKVVDPLDVAAQKIVGLSYVSA